MTKADLEACQARDEQSFRVAIESVTQKALQGGMADYDYKAAVGDAWRRGAMDAVVDERVDVAVSEVLSETSWGGLLQSLADNKKAQELATAVTERVYRSDAMKAALEQLAAGIGKDVGQRIETASEKAAEPALACLEAYLGPRYGGAVARIVSSDASRDFAFDAAKGGAGVSSSGVLARSGGGIAGAVILLVRRQLANMAGRIGQRLVGSVLSRLVSVVAGGVGLVLIAADLWDLRHGVLPTIAGEMKSPATKEKVREELASSIREEIGTHVAEIGAKAADQVVEVWREFRRAHAKALEIAEANESFRAFLDTLAPENIPRLDEVVSILLASEGEGAVVKRLGDGTLDRAVKTLPPPGMEIARETKSIDGALRWSAVAGDDLGKIVELGFHQRAKPQDFDKASLKKVLALGDPLAMARLASVSRATRDALFELDGGELTRLARQLDEAQLGTLASYLTNLEKTPRERILRAVAAAPAKMSVLGRSYVRDAILSSRDQNAAVAMVLREDSLIAPLDLAGDFQLAWEGRVSPLLLWQKHPASLIAGGILALFALLFLRWMLFPGRGRYA